MGNPRGGTKSVAYLGCVRLAVVVGVAITAGCGGDGDGETTAAASASGCKPVEAPARKRVSFKAPPQTVKKGQRLTAIVKTNCGDFEIALDSKRSPKTVNSFAFLAKKGFYEGLIFDRGAPDSFIHGGNPLNSDADTGGPGYRVDEAIPSSLSYEKGDVAMAQGPEDPPGHSGSQFFVVLAPFLDFVRIYAPLGRVEKGFDVVERIGRLGTPLGFNVPPRKLKRTVLIEEVTIEKG